MVITQAAASEAEHRGLDALCRTAIIALLVQLHVIQAVVETAAALYIHHAVDLYEIILVVADIEFIVDGKISRQADTQ